MENVESVWELRQDGATQTSVLLSGHKCAKPEDYKRISYGNM